MSLINEALKRANETRPAQPRDEGQLPPMRPVAATTPAVLWPLVAVPLALFLIFCLAVWFLWRGWQTLRHERAHATELVVAARVLTPESAPSPAPARPAEEKPVVASSLALPVLAPATPVPVTATNPTVSSNLVLTSRLSDAAPAPFKLQAIFYRPGKLSVVINSKTLLLGEFIADARVMAIGRSSVTLAQGNQTNVLTLR